MFWKNQMGKAEQVVLVALADGWTLKSHRTLDGEKHYRLHSLDGAVADVEPSVVERLTARRYLQSNQKFPAATYLLTEKGRDFAQRSSKTPGNPLTASRFLLNGRGE